MKYAESLIAGCLVLAAAAVIPQVNDKPQQAQQRTDAAKPRNADSDRGQQVFDQNCFRCHRTPEGFSPHISGAIAKHMRVRAGLSDADYKALLKFLNP